MTPRQRTVGVLLSLCLAFAGWMVAIPARSQDADVNSPDRQILVLLRQAPPHFRPGANYGGSYGDAMSRSALQRIGKRIAREHELRLVEDWPMPLLGLDCFIMMVPEGQSPETMATKVSQDPSVAWAEPMHLYQTRGSGTSYNNQLFPAEPAAQVWHLADLHPVATSRGVDAQATRLHVPQFCEFACVNHLATNLHP